MRTTNVLLAAVCVLPAPVDALAHKWDFVRDFMGMHGKYSAVPLDSDIEFVVINDSMITTGTSCGRGVNSTAGYIIEDSVLATAARIEAVNPDVKIGMYYRSYVALKPNVLGIHKSGCRTQSGG